MKLISFLLLVSISAKAEWYFIENPGGFASNKTYTECKEDVGSKLREHVKKASKKEVEYKKKHVHKTECQAGKEATNCYQSVKDESGKPYFFTIHFRENLYSCEYARAYIQNVDRK